MDSGFTLYTGGNSWALGSGKIESSSYTFKSLPAKFITYFYTESANTDFELSIVMNSTVAVSVMATIGSNQRAVNVQQYSNFSIVSIGNFLSTPGYNQIVVDINGSALGSGKVTQFKIDGNLTNLTYVPNNNGDNFYWGRRGSSCHLRPSFGASKNISYFYSQICVPPGFDPVGSYYMANGFGEGYMGIQTNSLTERKVLFSVWSGFNTNNPSQIPNDYTVTVDRIGPEVTSGTFGGEGSGAQTYLKFNWTAGKTYKFLTRAEPLSTNATTYTAWFNDPDNPTGDGWRLIAQITRPKIQTYLKSIYSFIQCFNPDLGNQTKMAYYGNQWCYDQTKTWKESKTASFSKDNTGNTNIRRDVQGGVYNGNMFFLKNGGFFNTTSAPGTIYTRIPNNIPPNVNFSTLP